jgi:hypothetical protein
MAALVDDRKMKSEMATSGAVARYRHMMKCRRRDKCPIMSCRRLQDETKDQLIQKWTPSPIGKHYAKCREGLDGQASCVHDCSKIRANMKWLKEKYFNESPMSLQLLAACAVPRDKMMDPHPHREELLRLNYSAERIQ